jgi:hypothetical protein
MYIALKTAERSFCGRQRFEQLSGNGWVHAPEYITPGKTFKPQLVENCAEPWNGGSFRVRRDAMCPVFDWSIIHRSRFLSLRARAFRYSYNTWANR